MYPIFTKMKKQKQEVKTNEMKETKKLKTRKKRTNDKENEKCGKGLMDWLRKDKVRQNTDRPIQNSNNGAAGQNSQMVLPSGDSKYSWMDRSEHRRKCQVILERENTITTKSEPNSHGGLSERENLK